MKIALYIAFNNSSSVNCCKEVIDIVSEENDIIIDSKIKSELSKEFQSKFSFFDSSDPIDIDIDYSSFTKYGIRKSLYEPYIEEAVEIVESYISTGLPDVYAGDYDGD